MQKHKIQIKTSCNFNSKKFSKSNTSGIFAKRFRKYKNKNCCFAIRQRLHHNYEKCDLLKII